MAEPAHDGKFVAAAGPREIISHTTFHYYYLNVRFYRHGLC